MFSLYNEDGGSGVNFYTKIVRYCFILKCCTENRNSLNLRCGIPFFIPMHT